MYTPDNLEKKLQVFESHPEVQLVYSDLSLIDDTESTIKKSLYGCQDPFPCSPISIEDMVLSMRSIFSYSSMMVRRGILDTIQIRQTGDTPSSVSDYDFSLQILSRYSAHYLDETLTQYRIHRDNLSLGSPRIAESMLELIDFYQKNHILSLQSTKLAKSRAHTSVAAGYILR
jgi:hypothetical protein